MFFPYIEPDTLSETSNYVTAGIAEYATSKYAT